MLISITYSDTTNFWPINYKIDWLIEMIQSLALAICTLKNKVDILGGNFRIITALGVSSFFQQYRASAS